MLVENLRNATKLAGMVANAYSMAPAFRTIELGSACASAVSECGSVSVATLELTGLIHKCRVDAVALNSVLTSLPEKGNITLEDKETVIHWKCGAAKGHFSKVVCDAIPDEPEHEDYPWEAPEELANAITLGSSACQHAAVSIGVYGVVLDFGIDYSLTVLSSNSIALAEACIPSPYFTSWKFTVRPPVPNILSALIKDAPKATYLDFTEKGIFVIGTKVIAHLALSPALTTDLKAVSNKYDSHSHVVPVDMDSVRKFLNRANALVDKHAATVSIAVEDGQIKLEHKGIVGASEEYFLADSLPKDLSFTGVHLPIHLLENALRGVDKVVLDYLPEKVLILHGDSPAFRYIISGQ